jgi:hypothetical protein
MLQAMLVIYDTIDLFENNRESADRNEYGKAFAAIVQNSFAG